MVGTPCPATTREHEQQMAEYPANLEREVAMLDGSVVHLRPIRPDDEARLVAFHGRLSSHSVYLRFFGFHPTLSANEVRRFTHVDYLNRLAFVIDLDGRLGAVGRYDRLEGTTEAEVAFVVDDELQHHGLGTLLLDELARAAWARGITHFMAHALAQNAPMLRVFWRSGFPVTSGFEAGAVRVPDIVRTAYASLRVTDIARAMVFEWGMSESVTSRTMRADNYALSEETKRVRDSEQARLTDGAYDHALSLLAKHRATLDRVAGALLEKETLQREELLVLVADVEPESRASESVGVPRVVASRPHAGDHD